MAPLSLAPQRSVQTPTPDGGFVLRSPDPLRPYARCLGVLLEGWAERAPTRSFLAEPVGAGWRTLSYRETLDAARALGQALLDLGLSASRPLMILADNGIDNALLQLGAMHAGVPVAPVSPAYATMSKDFARLRELSARLGMGAVYVVDGVSFEAALQAIGAKDLVVITSKRPATVGQSIPIESLRATRPAAALDRAFAAVGPDTIAKILFTSGSTGTPKGVLNTQRMLCSNQQAIAQVWPFLEERPPVTVDWLPWSHTFGGNHNFNMILRNGGTLYIDPGRPAPGAIQGTVESLGKVAPTLYFNVPRGFDVLLPYLEEDAALRTRFFSELDILFYAAAALPQNLWQRLEVLASEAGNERVRMLSAWGSTETAPAITSVHFAIPRAGVIGLPLPGAELKLVPTADRLEMRARGPNITPGYWEPGGRWTPTVLDEEGYLSTGDAGKLQDPDAPELGVVFDGRIAENFKLTTGTWVSVADLRLGAIAACAPAVADAVVTGHDRDALGLLLFPNLAGCRALVGDTTLDADALVAHPAVREHLARGLRAHNEEHGASSTRITRALVLAEPPSIDGGEITDKGYINQRAVLGRRASWVERLYAVEPDEAVLRFDWGAAASAVRRGLEG